MTAEYAAPEQLRDEAAGPGTDIYQLALVAYEALDGRHPFETLDPASRLTAQLDAPVPPLQHVDEIVATPVDAVLRRATDPDPQGRHPSMADFVSAMQAALKRS